MKLHAFTLALDAMPFITKHLPVFEASGLDWTWHVVHGAAANKGSSRWFLFQQPRLSCDGTAEYINSLQPHPRIQLYQQQWWPGGKDEMCNAVLPNIKEECVLMQIDADEIWPTESLQKVVQAFETRDINIAYLPYRYFVGPDIITTSGYGHDEYCGCRAWRFKPGMKWDQHSPPILSGNKGPKLSYADARALGITYDHYAYVLESQVLFKEHLYGYKGAVQQWKKLQANTQWPAKIADFLPWAKKGMAEKVKENPFVA